LPAANFATIPAWIRCAPATTTGESGLDKEQMPNQTRKRGDHLTYRQDPATT
jgi:hypothetical protein